MRQMFSKNQLINLINNIESFNVYGEDVERFFQTMKNNPLKTYMFFDADITGKIYFIYYDNEEDAYTGYGFDNASTWNGNITLEEGSIILDGEEYRLSISNDIDVNIIIPDNSTYTLNYSNMSEQQKASIDNLISQLNYTQNKLSFTFHYINSTHSNKFKTNNFYQEGLDTYYFEGYYSNYRFLIKIQNKNFSVTRYSL